MPLDIKEIVVTATVTEDFTESGSASQSTTADDSKEDLVAECVDQVMEILREKNEP